MFPEPAGPLDPMLSGAGAWAPADVRAERARLLAMMRLAKTALKMLPRYCRHVSGRANDYWSSCLDCGGAL